MSESHQFADRTLLDKFASLNLADPEGAVINHSASLATWGVIESHEPSDIDAAVSWENMVNLRRRIGFSISRKTVGYRPDGTPIQLIVTQDNEKQYDLHRWDFSVVRWKKTRHGRVYLPELIERSVQDPETGIWVATIDYVAETMTDTGREKDDRRLIRIEEFMQQQ